MFGIGAGAIAQVIVQIAPVDPRRGRAAAHPAGGRRPADGLLVMYATGLLVSV